MRAVTDVLEYAQVAASFATTATLIFALLQWRAARQQVLTLQRSLTQFPGHLI